MEVDKIAVILDFFGGTEMGKHIDGFMHAGDVFEKGKVLVNFEQIKLVLTSLETLEKIVDTLWDLHFKKKGYVVFIGVSKIGGVKPEKSYVRFKEGVQSLSMYTGGTLKWSMFKDCLEKLGYTVETDNRMHVTKVF